MDPDLAGHHPGVASRRASAAESGTRAPPCHASGTGAAGRGGGGRRSAAGADYDRRGRPSDREPSLEEGPPALPDLDPASKTIRHTPSKEAHEKVNSVPPAAPSW